MKLTDAPRRPSGWAQFRLHNPCAARRLTGVQAGRNVVGKLLTEGLVEETKAYRSLPVWHRGDGQGPLALRITKQGLAAIGVDAGDTRPEAEAAPNTKQATALAPDKPSMPWATYAFCARTTCTMVACSKPLITGSSKSSATFAKPTPALGRVTTTCTRYSSRLSRQSRS
jgi:hypothetical protein